MENVDRDMWQYQRPGFRGLLLAELQRQQRGSQFCDIMLRAEGVSVPAHSCVLSALSPQLSCTLPSTPPPTGQTHLLEFGAVRASTLLRLVGLLYSGEIVGQGEEEREDILSATARLGISGLVEVRESGEDRSGRRAVGIQTEPLMLEERGGREGSNGSALPVGATRCSIERGTGSRTQMGELPTDATHLTPQPASESPDPYYNIPYVPLSIFYPPDAHHPPCSDYMAPTEESTAGGHGPVFIVPQSYSSLIPTPTHFACHTPTVVYDHASEVLPPESGGEGFEQFEGNIPGFINYFLNPGQAESSCGRRRGKRRVGGAGGARQTRTGERKAQRPRGGTGRRGRPPKQTAAALGEEKEVVKSIPPKNWLRSWGVHARRSGRGGGAAGRMLYLNTRDHFQPLKLCLKKRGRGKSWKICSVREEPSRENGGAAAQQLIREGALALNKQKTPPTVMFHSTPPQLLNTQTGNASLNPPTLPTELSASQSLHIPQGPFLAPAPEMFHTTLLPSLEPPSHVEQAEQLDRLLEEVMMGLDILDKNNNSKSTRDSHPHPLTHPAAGADNAVIQQECHQRSIPTGHRETASGVHNIPTKTVTVATGVGGFVPGSCEVPVLQQPQGEGGLSDILDNFLFSFEQQVSNCSTGARVEKDGQTCTQASYDASTTMSSSQSQPCTVGRDQSIAGQSHTHAARTICPAHLEHIHSPHPVQALMSPIHPQNPGTYTPPPISSKLPPVSVAKLPSSDAVTNDSNRRQRRDRKVSPEQPSVARLAKPIERENAGSDAQPISAASAVASSVSTMLVPSIPPKAPNSVRKPELKLVIKKKRKRDERMEGDHNEQAKRPHSLQPIIRVPQLFSGQSADLKSTLIPPERRQIKTTVKAYPIRSKVTNQQDKHVEETLSGEPPLLAKRPTSAPQVVQPIVIKKHKSGIRTVELKTGHDREDRRGKEIDLLLVDKPVPAISAGQPHPVEHRDVGVQMEEWRDIKKEQGRATSPEEGSQGPERKGDKRQRESEDELTTNSVEQAELTSTFQTKPKASILEPHADSQDVMEVSSEELVVTVESEEEGTVEVLNHSDSDNNDQDTLASEDGRATTQGAVEQGEEASESINLKMKESSQKVEKNMRENSEEELQGPERRVDKRQRDSEEELTTNIVEQAELTSTFQTKPKASILETNADSQDVMEVSREKLVVKVESVEEGAVDVLNHSDSDNNDHPQDALASEDGRATTQGAVQRGEEASESIDLKMKESNQKVEKNMKENSEEELQGPERRGDKRQRDSEEELTTNIVEQAELTSTFQSKPKASILETNADSQDVMKVSSEELVVTVESEEEGAVEVLNHSDSDNNDQDALASEDGRATTQGAVQRGEEASEPNDLKMKESSQKVEKNMRENSEEELQGPERRGDKRQRESEEELATHGIEQAVLTSTFQTKPKAFILETNADSQDVMEVSREKLVVTVESEEEGAVDVLNHSDSDNNDHPQDALASEDGRATTQGAVERGEEASESIDLKMKESNQKVEKNMKENSEEELQGQERRGDKRQRESEEELGTKAAKRKRVEQAELTVSEHGTFQSKPEDVIEVSSKELVMTLKSEEDVDVEVHNFSDNVNIDHLHYTLACEDGQATAQRRGQREEEASEWTNLKIRESSQKVEKNVGETSEEELKGTSSDEYINIVDSDENIDVVEETDVCLQCRYTDLHNSPNRMRKTPVPLHYGITKPPPEPRIPHPPLATKVELGSTGSRDDEEDDDVDIIGWTSPLPVLRTTKPPPEPRMSHPPIATRVDLGSTGSRDDEEDDDVDIIGWTSPLPELRTTKPPPEPRMSHPPIATKVDLGSTGSREDAEDEEELEVDIIGWTSPFPDPRSAKPRPKPQMSHPPLATKVDLGSTVISEEEKDEEEEEVDVIGSTSPFPNPPKPIKCELMLSETEMR